MAELKDVIAYILQDYPYASELSNARVTKIVYLADWKQAIQHQSQITDINWYFDNYGPFVWDVQKTVSEHPELFESERTNNAFGSPKTLFKIKDDTYTACLTQEEKESIDHVIEQTKSLNWNDFIKLIYSTYPITSSEKYSSLNLVEKATDYLLEGI